MLASARVSAGQGLPFLRAVFPVFVTGLHCGIVPTVNQFEPGGVFPVFVTGLHCGIRWAWAKHSLAAVFPVFVTGLHCGHWEMRNLGAACESSRSS